jgi:TPR repeat protein
MDSDNTITAVTYRCFISYRHADNHAEGRRWATWLHQSLERYPVPPGLIGEPNQRGQPIPPRIFPVFRDEEELSADADLSTPILRALENSLGMVVICSPRARASRFIDDEVRLYKRETDGDRILGMVIAGSPDPAGLAADSCLPDAYVHRTDARGNVRPEPESPRNLLDLRTHDGKEGWIDSAKHQATLESAGMDEAEAEAEVEAFARHREEQFLRIVAHVLEVAPETLLDHHQRHQEKLRKSKLRSRILWGTLILLLAVATVKGIQLSLEQSKAADAAAIQAADEARLVLQKKAELAEQQQKTSQALAVNRYNSALDLRKRPGTSAETIEKAFRFAAQLGHPMAQYELGRQMQIKVNDPVALQEAAGWFEKSARQGNAPAMEALGVAYRDGRGVTRDFTQSELWLRQAAAAKVASAHFELSRLLTTVGRSDESLRSLSEAAEAGHVLAQFELAKIFLAKTPSADIAKSRKWLELAAGQGFTPAIRELGLTYLAATKGSADILEAIRLLQAAEAKGDKEAAERLVQVFADESTIPKGRAEAFRWHLARATRGNAASQNFVGVAYRDGLGVVMDLNKANDFLRMAERSGLADAQYNLGVLCGTSGFQFYALRNAFELKGRAARQGHLQAMADIAGIYIHGWEDEGPGKLSPSAREVASREGFGTPEGEAKGMNWLQKAAEGGHAPSMLELGQRLLLEFEKTKSETARTRAQRWLTAASEKDFPEAKRTLGLLLFKSDPQAGIRLIRQAAELGDPASQYTLGVALRDGQGLKANRLEAIRWFRLAADHELDDAEYALGLALLQGKDPKEIAQAADWIRKAAEQGHFAAQLQLAEMLVAGMGLKPDSAVACKWFLVASTNKAATPQQKTVALKRAQTTATRLAPEQLAEAQQTAIIFIPTKPRR